MTARIMGGAIRSVEAWERAEGRHRAIFPSHSCTMFASTAGVNDMRPLRARRRLAGRTPRWRKALVVGCALLLVGLAIAATPAAPARAGDSGAAHAAPWAAAAAEARILADRILQRESDALLLEGPRQRTLGHEIKQALSLIRQRYPAMAETTAMDWHERELVLELEGALRNAVMGSWSNGEVSSPPHTGHVAFDALNETLSVRVARVWPRIDSVIIRLGERANMPAAIPAYEAVDGVVSAYPNYHVGDFPDIETAKVRDTWHVVFRKAWGDCPSGCIFRELTFFTVADGEAALVEPAQARGMAVFAALVAGRGWR